MPAFPRARRASTLFCIAALALLAARSHADTRLSVMSFNAWGAGLNDDKPIDETVAVIRASGADVVALMESRAEAPVCGKECPAAGPGVAPAIARALGFHLHEQHGAPELQWANAVLSRYPITRELGEGLGVEIDVNGAPVQIYTAHFPDWPYQPFQLLGIEYDGAPFLRSAEQAVDSARETRGPGVNRLLHTIRTGPPAAAVFVCGDFNEPSHRDWTAPAVAAGAQPMVVAWPTVAAFESDGFTDTWRAVHPDPVKRPGFTWSPRTTADDPADHHDRIDFVLVRGASVRVESAQLIGEAASQADIVVTPWPSDHRAIMATVRLATPAATAER